MGFKSSSSWGNRYQWDHPGEHGPPVPGKVCHSPTGQMNPSWVDRSFRVSLYSVVVIFLPPLLAVKLPARLPLLPFPVLDVLPDPIPQGGPFFWSELRHVLPPPSSVFIDCSPFTTIRTNYPTTELKGINSKRSPTRITPHKTPLWNDLSHWVAGHKPPYPSLVAIER